MHWVATHAWIFLVVLVFLVMPMVLVAKMWLEANKRNTLSDGTHVLMLKVNRLGTHAALKIKKLDGNTIRDTVDIDRGAGIKKYPLDYFVKEGYTPTTQFPPGKKPAQQATMPIVAHVDGYVHPIDLLYLYRLIGDPTMIIPIQQPDGTYREEEVQLLTEEEKRELKRRMPEPLDSAELVAQHKDSTVMTEAMKRADPDRGKGGGVKAWVVIGGFAILAVIMVIVIVIGQKNAGDTASRIKSLQNTIEHITPSSGLDGK